MAGKSLNINEAENVEKGKGSLTTSPKQDFQQPQLPLEYIANEAIASSSRLSNNAQSQQAQSNQIQGSQPSQSQVSQQEDVQERAEEEKKKTEQQKTATLPTSDISQKPQAEDEAAQAAQDALDAATFQQAKALSDTVDENASSVPAMSDDIAESASNNLDEDSLSLLATPKASYSSRTENREEDVAAQEETSEDQQNQGDFNLLSEEAQDDLPAPSTLEVLDPDFDFDPIDFGSTPSAPFRYAQEENEEREKRALGQEYKYGNKLGGYVISSPIVGLRDIWVGHEILLAALEQPTSTLRRQLSEELKKYHDNIEPEKPFLFTEENLLDVAQTRNSVDVSNLIGAINDLNLRVFTKKDPTVGDGDQHLRRMQIVYGEAMYMHPLASKLYNADHDGDTMGVSLEPWMNNYVPDAMDKIVSSSGTAMIDEDFFMLHPWDADALEKGVRNILIDLDIENTRVIDDVIKCLDKIINGKNVPFSRFLKLLKKASNYSSREDKLEVFASLIDGIYKWNNEQWRRFMADDRNSLPNSYTPPEKKELFTEEGDQVLADWMDDACETDNLDMFLNFQEAKNYFANALGLVPGKNLEFRIGAGIAKLLKIEDSMIIGDHVVINDSNFNGLMTKSIDFLYSNICSNRLFAGEKHIYAKQFLIDRFIDVDDLSKGKTLLPSMYNLTYPDGTTEIDWASFSAPFYRRYEQYAPMLDSADVKIRIDNTIADKNTKFVGRVSNSEQNDFEGKVTGRVTGSISDFSRKFQKIYGDIKLGALFASDINLIRGYYIDYTKDGVPFKRNIGFKLEDYKNMTLNEFIRTNQGQVTKPNGFSLKEPISGIKQYSSHHILYALSDLHKKSASEFDRKLGIASKHAVKRLAEMNEILESWDDTSKRNYSTFIEVTTDALCKFGPDVFSYYKMDTPEFWINSKWGRKLMATAPKKNEKGQISDSQVDSAADKFNDVLNQMTIEYRLSRPREVLEEYKESLKNDSIEDTKTSQQLRSKYGHAMDVLASSSPFWSILVSDIKSEGAIFADARDLASTAEKKKSYFIVNNMLVGDLKRGVFLDGKTVQKGKKDSPWDRVSKLGIDSLMSLIKSEDFTWDEKENVISDTIKLEMHSIYASHEINYMIRQNPDTVYAGNRFEDLGGYSQVMEDVKAASDDLNRNSKKTWDEITKDVNEGLSTYGAKGVEKLLNAIKRNPYSLVEIDPSLYAAAVSYSVFDKEHDDSEKSKQQDIMNMIFTSISYMRSGGIYSDLAVTDDIMTGRIAEDRFQTNYTLQALLLADEDLELTIYNERGEFIASRATLCGKKPGEKATANDVLSFLQEHPRVAMSLRKHKPSAGKEGKCYLLASENFTQCLNRVSQGDRSWKDAYHHLINRPGFGALLVATTPSTRTTAWKKSEEVEENIKKLTIDLMRLSNKSEEEIVSIVENIDFGNIPRDAFAEKYNLGYNEIDQIYEDKVSRLKRHIIRYAFEVSKLDISLKFRGEPKFNYFRLDDINTFSAIEDVEQMLTGAQTATMTAVNGAETMRNGIFPFYASMKSDPCSAEPISVSVEDLRENFDRYEGWHIASNNGKDRLVLFEYLEEICKGNDSVLLYDPATCLDPDCPCKNHAVADGSTNNVSARYMTAMSLMFIIQRMDSTEKNNLKWKKLGIYDIDDTSLGTFDKYDSITKFSLIDILKGWKNLKAFNGKVDAFLQEAYLEGGMPEARRKYAKVLQENQESLGYDDLSISQYENIAHMLLFEDNEKVKALSASQLSYIVNKGPRLKDLYDCDNVPDVQRLMIDAVHNYKNNNGSLDIEETLANVKVRRQDGAIVTERKRANSFERNLKTSYQIWKEITENNPNARPLTKEEVKDISTGIATRNMALVYEFPYAFNIKKDKKGRFKRGLFGTKYYNLIGIVTDKENTQNIHVPARDNLWIVDISAGLETIKQALDTAERCGISVAMTEATAKALQSDNSDIIPVRYKENLMESSGRKDNNTYMIPFFDLKQNGYNSRSSYDPESSFNVGVHSYHPSRLIRMVEDPFNSAMLGDGQAAATEEYFDRSEVYKTGAWRVKQERLFADTIDEMVGGPIDVHVLSRSEEIATIFNAPSFEDLLPILSLGVKENKAVIKDTEIAYRKYRSSFTQSKADDFTYSNCRPGDIVGWARIAYESKSGEIVEKYAPIRPYQLGEKKGCPSKFDVVFHYNDLTGEIICEWTHQSSLAGHAFKFFEGINPFNKLMIDGNYRLKSRSLRSGNPIDVFVAVPSTASRRMSNVRIDTMYTLIAEARVEPHGYNLAEHDWALPNRPDIKTALFDGTAKFSDWKNWSKERIEFIDEGSTTSPMHAENKRLNSFLNMQVKKALSIGVNPSYWLASRFGENKIPHYKGFHYKAMMSSDIKYQKDLQAWLNKMDPTLCPKMYEDYTKTLFRNDPDTGALQMQVPYYTPEGKEFFWWSNIYTSFSFMDQHYSGGEKPHISGKRLSIPGLLTLGYGGKYYKGNTLKHLIAASMADRSIELADNMSMQLDPDDDTTE